MYIYIYIHINPQWYDWHHIFPWIFPFLKWPDFSNKKFDADFRPRHYTGRGVREPTGYVAVKGFHGWISRSKRTIYVGTHIFQWDMIDMISWKYLHMYIYIIYTHHILMICLNMNIYISGAWYFRWGNDDRQHGITWGAMYIPNRPHSIYPWEVEWFWWIPPHVGAAKSQVISSDFGGLESLHSTLWEFHIAMGRNFELELIYLFKVVIFHIAMLNDILFYGI